MKTLKKLLLIHLLIIFTVFSCEKNEVLPANQAKGKIVARFAMCYGAWVMIEVENPKGIGKAGEWIYNRDQKLIYKNAIGVPYFDRMPWLDTDAPDSEGTWLHFEYRELTEEECGDKDLFTDTYSYRNGLWNGVCNGDVVRPSVPMFMITKIIDYH